MTTAYLSDFADSLHPTTAEDYQTLIESFAQAFWETDARGRIVSDSPSWRTYTGQSLEDWLGEGWITAVHPNDQIYALQQWKEALTENRPVNAEFRLKRPDGGWRWTNVRATRIYNADGTIKKWLGINIDISDKKEIELNHLRLMEATAQQATNKYQKLFNSMDEGFEILELIRDDTGKGIDFRFLEINPSFERLVGLPTEHALGRTCRELFPTVDDWWIEAYSRVVDTGQAAQFEHYFKETNSWYKVSVYATDGEQFALVYTDITEQKKAEETLRDSEIRKAFLLELSDAIRDLTEPLTIQQEAIRVLRQHLQASRVSYTEALPNKVLEVIAVDSAPGEIDLQGQCFPLTDFAPEVIEEWCAGQMSFRNDVTQQEHVSDEQKAIYERFNLKSWANIPLVKKGELVAMITIHFPDPHLWTLPELSLLEVTAERIWAATERAKAEVVSRQSEKKLRTLFDSMEEGLALCELVRTAKGEAVDFRFLEVNPAYERHSGIANEKVIGRLRSEVLPVMDSTIPLYDRVVRTQEPLHIEQFASSVGRWFELRAVGYEAERFAIFFSDITPRKKAEETLRKSEERQSFLLKLNDTLRPLIDPVQIQGEACRLLGEQLQIDRACYARIDVPQNQLVVERDYTRGNGTSLVGTYTFSLVQPLIEVLQEGHAFCSYDQLPDAHLSYAALAVQSFLCVPLIKGGQLIAGLSVGSIKPRIWTSEELELIREVGERTCEVVERVRVEKALRDSEERLQLALSAGEIGTWQYRLETNDNILDSSMSHLLGLSPETQIIPQQAFIDAIHPEDRALVQEEVRLCLSEGREFNLDFRVQRPDTTVIWLKDKGKVMRDENGRAQFVTGAALNITQRKEAEEALQQADRRKDEFLAMLAHELRNPMATIRNGLQILSLPTTDERQREHTLTMMNRQSEHLVRLVDDLLDVSRISQGKIELKKESLDLVELVTEVAQVVRPQFEEGRRQLNLNLPDRPIRMEADALRLSQVLTNLLTNGVRYTKTGGQIELVLNVQEDEQYGQAVLLQVRDDGIGLAADQLVSIFELFVQVDNSVARSEGGLGLGLTLVRRLVELHGGRVEAYSAGLGLGSTFTIYLPNLPVPLPQPVAAPQPQSSVRHRILVVDDNPDATLTLGMLLELKGYEVFTQNSGMEGIRAAEQLRPDVILLDIGMPELDGYETCRLLRKEAWGQDILLIALTGYGQWKDKRRTQEAGFDEHLVKPVNLDLLTQIITDRLKGY
ncbi:PAS domain S-box protein [Siphonobacter sp.]|uniref:PAS domain S-box protein n=1 Tax=Siphonobacter sp. TaxID=1869184 RepID=UPI003B3BA815